MSTTYRGITVPAGPDDANVPLSFQQFLDSILPVGKMELIYDTAAPSGWLLCDGSPIPAGSQYDALRTKVGGANTPDMRGRMAVMPNGTTIPSIGSASGAPSVSLVAANIPQHTHTATATGAAFVTIGWTPNVPGFGFQLVNGPNPFVQQYDYHNQALATQPTITVDATGPATVTAVNTMPPYRGVNYIIKY
jgi:microcystin-dependent protein